MNVQEIYPWGHFVIDEATGLPLVPEKHFIRVRRSMPGYWRLELRRKRPGWFSRVEESAVSDIQQKPITRDRVLEGAAYVLWRYAKRTNGKSDLSLIGDYPPKALS